MAVSVRLLAARHLGLQPVRPDLGEQPLSTSQRPESQRVRRSRQARIVFSCYVLLMMLPCYTKWTRVDTARSSSCSAAIQVSPRPGICNFIPLLAASCTGRSSDYVSTGSPIVKVDPAPGVLSHSMVA